MTGSCFNTGHRVLSNNNGPRGLSTHYLAGTTLSATSLASTWAVGTTEHLMFAAFGGGRA